MISNAWSILCESAVFILAGFLIAGLLEALLSGEKSIRLLSGRRPRSVVMATLIGVPLPLCSCGVLPAAVTLRKKGASKGATLAFLISTPETSVTSILLTYALLGPLMAVFRPIAACVTALVAGLVESISESRHASSQPLQEEATTGQVETDAPGQADGTSYGDSADGRGPASARLREAMRFAFEDLFDDIFGWILIGIVAAAVIQAWLPAEVLNKVLGGPLQSMLLMVVIGVPLYVCAEGSTPIAAALIAQGMNPGAALVLLLVGPATNIGSLGVLHQQLGRRTVVVYLTTIILVALIMGSGLNTLITGSPLNLVTRALDEPLVPAWLKTIGAIVFLVLAAASIHRLRYVQRVAGWLDSRTPFPVSPRGVRVAVGIMVACVYAGSGFFMVRPGELGIVRRFGVIQRSDLPPGLHYALPYPIDRVDRVPVDRVYRLVIGFPLEPSADPLDDSNANEAWSLVGDENIADIRSAIHWGAVESEILRFQYSVAAQEQLVRNAILGSMREVLGGASINTAFTADRWGHEQDIERLAQQRLDIYGSGIRIHSFHILDAHAPPRVHAAFRDVASAMEDRATKIDEARAEEARIVPQARGEAAQQIAEAHGYADETVRLAKGEADRFLSVLGVYCASPEVTGLRLELETLEQVLPKLRKYLKPPDAQAGELEIWFVGPDAAEELAR